MKSDGENEALQNAFIAVDVDGEQAPRADVDTSRLREMLATLEQDRLVEFLTDLASQHSAVYDYLKSALRSDPTQRRLFVRGLSRNCTNEDLLGAFAIYGQVDEAVVMKEKGTQSCKGFGFVTFADADAADAAMSEPDKLIAGRMATCNLAAQGNKNRPSGPSHPRSMQSSSYAPSYYESNGGYNRGQSSNKRYRDGSPYSSSHVYNSYSSYNNDTAPYSANQYSQQPYSNSYQSRGLSPYRAHQSQRLPGYMSPYSSHNQY